MSARLAIGSQEHKVLFCRALIDTHDPYDPARIQWPDIDTASRDRIAALPFWQDAIADEYNAHRKLEALAARQDDPLLAEALAMQGREEGRHARIIEGLLRAYGIPVAPLAPASPPANPEFAYMKLGYGECCDSFFAFGMFKIAERSGFFPKALVQVFEPIVQEEARHIVFFQNWVAYVRANRPALHRPLHRLTCARSLALSVWTRARIGLSLTRGGGPKERKSSEGFDGVSLRQYLELCQAENTRRVAGFDPRLLRPTLIPGLVGGAIRLLPRGRAGDAPGGDAKTAGAP